MTDAESYGISEKFIKCVSEQAAKNWRGENLLLSPLRLLKDDPTQQIAGSLLSCIRVSVEQFSRYLCVSIR